MRAGKKISTEPYLMQGSQCRSEMGMRGQARKPHLVQGNDEVREEDEGTSKEALPDAREPMRSEKRMRAGISTVGGQAAKQQPLCSS